MGPPLELSFLGQYLWRGALTRWEIGCRHFCLGLTVYKMGGRPLVRTAKNNIRTSALTVNTHVK